MRTLQSCRYTRCAANPSRSQGGRITHLLVPDSVTGASSRYGADQPTLQLGLAKVVFLYFVFECPRSMVLFDSRFRTLNHCNLNNICTLIATNPVTASAEGTSTRLKSMTRGTKERDTGERGYQDEAGVAQSPELYPYF